MVSPNHVSQSTASSFLSCFFYWEATCAPLEGGKVETTLHWMVLPVIAVASAIQWLLFINSREILLTAHSAVISAVLMTELPELEAWAGAPEIMTVVHWCHFLASSIVRVGLLLPTQGQQQLSLLRVAFSSHFAPLSQDNSNFLNITSPFCTISQV